MDRSSAPGRTEFCQIAKDEKREALAVAGTEGSRSARRNEKKDDGLAGREWEERLCPSAIFARRKQEVPSTHVLSLTTIVNGVGTDLGKGERDHSTGKKKNEVAQRGTSN